MIKKKIIYGCESRGDYNSPYLIRYTLFDCRLFQICLHVFIRSDASEHHDHPWNFVSIILWRGYFEETKAGKKRVYPGMILFRKATHRHRVELINNKRAVTLVIKRDWGFLTKKGWIVWTRYFIERGC